MTEEQKKETAQQIVKQTANVVRIIGQYSELFHNRIVDNVDAIIYQLISITGNIDLYWRERLGKAKKDASLCSELIKKIENLQILFQNQEYVSKITPQYLQLVNLEIYSERNLDSIGIWLTYVLQHIDIIFNESFDTNIKNNVIQQLSNILNQSNNVALRFLQRLAHLDNFEYFGKIEHSVVIVGANGSGKSTFSRNTRRILNGNVVIISAQKVFNLQQINNIPLGEKALQTVYNFQSEDKLGKNWGNQDSQVQDLNNLMLSLIAEHNRMAHDFYSRSRNSTSIAKRELSILEKTMEIWDEIIIHREMKYEGPYIKICTDTGDSYDFPHLSDGEKAIFYYISHILLAKENSFIIIDEPENHLHMGVVSRLWDKLEFLRSDCKFIYLTHNLVFASSRIQATKFWSKSFIPPAKWDIVPLPTNEDLPDSLLMEMLGSRKKILFCEGEKSSLDYKLYTLLFPNYTIKPVGGHLEVINFTRAFNKSKDIFGNTAIGIIDGDFHSGTAKEKWLKESIFCIEVQEVENLLCDEKLLEESKVQFCCSDDEMEEAKNKIFQELKHKKEAQAIEYASQKINNILKSNLLEKPKTKDELKEQLKSSIQSIEIDNLINERTALFDKIISEKNYDIAIKSFNSKGLISIIGNIIVKDYKKRIIRLLEADDSLIKHLREKYFSKIPQP